MELKSYQPIEYKKDNLLVRGEYLERTKSTIKARIIYPYTGWIGTIKSDDDSFLTEQGHESAVEMLRFGYEKLSLIDKNINDLMPEYRELLEDLSEVQKLEDPFEINRVSKALKIWFLNFRIFHQAITGIPMSYHEVEYFERIFNAYNETGTKIYLSEAN